MEESDPEYEAAYQAELQRLAKEELDKERQKQRESKLKKIREAELETQKKKAELIDKARRDAAAEIERLKREEHQKALQAEKDQKKPESIGYVIQAVVLFFVALGWFLLTAVISERQGRLYTPAELAFIWLPITFCIWGILHTVRTYRSEETAWLKRIGQYQPAHRESARTQMRELIKWTPMVLGSMIGILLLILYLTDNMELVF